MNHTFFIAVLVAVALDDLWLRHELRRRKRENAVSVEAALSDRVTVDGIELPKPDDERWTIKKYITTDTRVTVMKLSIGDLRVDETGYIQYADGMPSIPATPATKNYCAAVWKAYRSRVARKAIETST